MTPKSMALAYRIWGDCKLHGWDRPVADVADSLAEDVNRIRRIAQRKGWLQRFRSSVQSADETNVNWIDDGLDRVAGEVRFGTGGLTS